MKPLQFKQFLKTSLVENPEQPIMVLGKVGIGKCIHLNSKSDFVLSGDGKMIHLTKTPLQVVTLNSNSKLEKSKVVKSYNRVVNDLLRITTKTGKVIELTPEHPLYSINGWQVASMFNKGDYIATPRRYDLQLTKRISEDYLKIIAYLLAEGCLCQKSIRFTNSDKRIVFELRESVQREYPTLTLKKLNGKDGQYIISKKILTGHLKGNNHPLLNRLRIEGLTDKKSDTKFIPDEITGLCNKQIALFLNRFYSCDGYVSNGYVGLTLKSEIIIRQIQHLLLRFGIISSIYKKFKCATNTIKKTKRLYWELLITSNEGRRLFKEQIGFYLEYKQKAILINDKTNTNIDIIPFRPIKKQEYRDANGRWIKGVNRMKVLPKLPTKYNWIYPSRPMLKKFAEYYNDDVYLKLAESDIFWDKIKEIEILKGEFQVWDIEVDHKDHNFVVNDIIVHNSDTVKQVCQELGFEIRDIRLSLLDATDLRGLPSIDKEAKTTLWTRPVFLPPENYDKDVVLFFDEFSNANASLQNASLQLCLDRQLGEYKLPPRTRVICAGNKLEHGAFVFKMSAALNNRFVNIDFETDFDDWKVWAYANRIHPIIIAYHNYTNGTKLHSYNPDIEGAFATPRSWFFTHRLLNIGLNNGVLYEAIKGTIGEAVGTEFYGFYKIYGTLPDPKEILAGKDIVPKDNNVIYALVSALINEVRSDPDKLNRLIKYSLKLPKEFSVVLIKDLYKTELRNNLITSTAFNSWLEENKGFIV